MRLLDAKTQILTTFRDGDEPAYAVLSHTWLYPNDREVQFQDVQHLRDYKAKDGYRKIEFVCNRAKADGLNFVWVDTCCINKTDPLELGKAINSMYHWYRKSTECYVFLEDVSLEREKLSSDFVKSSSNTFQPLLDVFSHCRWFTRGWTLQEMIAPKTVNFYDTNGIALGSRHELAPVISRVTRIDESALLDIGLREHITLDDFSVAQRLAWASTRQTTEPEDIAYCLVGIFGVYMALQYGEGPSRAFIRLQKEIMTQTSDESVLAWQGDDNGLLASSPLAYQHSQSIVPLQWPLNAVGHHDLINGRCEDFDILGRTREAVRLSRTSGWRDSYDDFGL